MYKYARVWLEVALEDLDSAKLLYANTKYAQAIYFLQQCNEKLSKALLIEMGFIKTPDESEEARTFRRLLKINLSERDFGHRWHEKLIRMLEDILHVSVYYESIAASWNLERPEELYLTKNLPDFQQKINAAKKISTIPDPSHEEVLVTIKISKEILGKLVDIRPQLEKAVSEIKQLDVDKIMNEAELQMGVKLDKSYRKQLKKKVQDPVPGMAKVILYSQMVTILAILSIYLVDHEVYARYPSPDFSKKYDPNLGVVGLFNELASVHDDIIAMITQEDTVNFFVMGSSAHVS